MEIWLGKSYFYGRDWDGDAHYSAFAAVYCASQTEFRIKLAQHLAADKLTLSSVEDVCPAREWQTRPRIPSEFPALFAAAGADRPVVLGQSARQQSQTLGPFLRFDAHTVPALPDPAGKPFWERDWIAPELRELLFTGPDTDERTYCLIDAAHRRRVRPIFDLDAFEDELEIRCLYIGDAAETLQETAPYLLDVTLPPEAETPPRFHRDFFQNHWGQGGGVFVRTKADFDTVWRHFRKFTKTQMQEDQRTTFFQFQVPQTLQSYFAAIQRNGPKCRCFLTLANGQALRFYIEKTATELSVVSPDMDALTSVPRVPFQLSYADFDSSVSDARKARLRRMAERIKSDFKEELAERPLADIEAIADRIIQKFAVLGFTQQQHLHFFVAWAVFFGEQFAESDPEGQLIEICKSDAPEADRFHAFKQRFDSFKRATA